MDIQTIAETSTLTMLDAIDRAQALDGCLPAFTPYVLVKGEGHDRRYHACVIGYTTDGKRVAWIGSMHDELHPASEQALANVTNLGLLRETALGLVIEASRNPVFANYLRRVA
jgi:hypothetical protein